MRCSMCVRAERCVSPRNSRSRLTAFIRVYIEATSVTVCGDHSRSAIAALRGQMCESIFSGVTHSAHWQDSPPRMRLFSSGVSVAAASAMGSTA